MRRIQLAAFALSLAVALLLACTASAAPRWLPPFDLSSATQNVGTASIGLDRGGDAVAVWWSESDSSYVVRARERAAARQWTLPHDLSARADYIGGVDLAVNSAGDAIAVWAAQRGSYFAVEVSTRPAGGDWEAPQVLWLRGEPASWAVFVGDVRVALNRRGDAVAMWRFAAIDTEPPYTESRDLDVAIRTGHGDWSAPTSLTRYPLQDSADVGLDAAGNAVAVWTEQREAGGPSVVLAARRPARGAWKVPERVSPVQEGSAWDPQLAVDAAGNVVAVWTGGSGLHVSRRPAGGSWSRRPHLLSRRSESDFFEPSVAADAAGDLTVVWQEGERQGRRIVPWIKAATRPRAGTWSKPTTIGRGYDPNVALDAAGGAVAVWRKNLIMVAARKPARGSWSRVSVVRPAGVLAVPNVAVDGHGNALVDWMNESQNGRWNEAAALDAAGPVFAKLSIPARARVGVQVRFSVSPFDVWSGLGKAPRWSFGDGGSVRGTSVTHRYRIAGAYRVRVSQSDVRGNRTSVSRSLLVVP